MGLASSVFARSNDSSGTITGVFRSACKDIGTVALLAEVDPTVLANRVYEALVANDYGQYDGLIGNVAPALGQSGLEQVKQHIITLSQKPVQVPPQRQRRVVGHGSSGVVYEDEMAERSRLSTVRLALKDIADAQEDVDAYIAQYDEETRKVPTIATEIAQRLLAADRLEEALAFTDAARTKRSPGLGWPNFELVDTRIEALEALNRTKDAQVARWGCFEQSLSVPHLRAYLSQLPDFEEVVAEEQAHAHAEEYPSPLSALAFFLAWPALDRAARVVLNHYGKLDGNNYETLNRAADALAVMYPLAATMALRAMIDDCLINKRSSRYKHAARHLLECSRLAKGIGDFREFESHDAYESRLKQEHGRKQSFWRHYF